MLYNNDAKKLVGLMWFLTLLQLDTLAYPSYPKCQSYYA